jgi:hypothetical protein
MRMNSSSRAIPLCANFRSLKTSLSFDRGQTCGLAGTSVAERRHVAGDCIYVYLSVCCGKHPESSVARYSGVQYAHFEHVRSVSHVTLALTMFIVFGGKIYASMTLSHVRDLDGQNFPNFNETKSNAASENQV